MEVTINLGGAKLATLMATEGAAGAYAVAATVRARAALGKRLIRKQVTSAGLGDRLANTVRSSSLPNRGPSLGITGFIRSSAQVGKSFSRPGGLVDLVAVFDEGATIRARGHAFLAIPTALVGRTGRGQRKLNPSEFPAGQLVFKPVIRGKVAGLLVDARDPRRVLFVLVKQVHLAKRLDIQRAFTTATAGLEDRIVAGWEKKAAQLHAKAQAA